MRVTTVQRQSDLRQSGFGARVPARGTVHTVVSTVAISGAGVSTTAISGAAVSTVAISGRLPTVAISGRVSTATAPEPGAVLVQLLHRVQQRAGQRTIVQKVARFRFCIFGFCFRSAGTGYDDSINKINLDGFLFVFGNRNVLIILIILLHKRVIIIIYGIGIVMSTIQ